jgi:phosphonate transport system permease protein
MSTKPITSQPRHWSPPPLIANVWVRYLVIAAVLGYLILALSSIEIDPERIAEGWTRTSRLLADFFQPDFRSRWGDIRTGMLESLTMTVVATAAGLLLSLPLSLGAASNIAPRAIYLVCRSLVILTRTFPEVVIALLFVVMVGFGPLAGVITLSLASAGFIAKLLAEDIEDINSSQLEAMRATGASWAQIIVYGVAPQVLPRFIGLAAYRLDINFRESAILGIVGAGGIGAVLRTSIRRYDFNTTGAILALIIGIVLVLELLSSRVRAWVQ